jgi:hypothetical protein
MNVIKSREIHSGTSSAVAVSICGIISPSAFAVLRLMTGSKVFGCSTGKSAGCARFERLHHRSRPSPAPSLREGSSPMLCFRPAYRKPGNLLPSSKIAPRDIPARYRRRFLPPRTADQWPSIRRVCSISISSAVLPRRGGYRPLCYWCIQRAKAGPGLFEHDAVSVSPFLVIETAPCGHVTDASVSPASQANLQFDEP